MLRDFSSIHGIAMYGSIWVSGIDLIHNASTRSSAIVEVQLIPQADCGPSSTRFNNSDQHQDA